MTPPLPLCPGTIIQTRSFLSSLHKSFIPLLLAGRCLQALPSLLMADFSVTSQKDLSRVQFAEVDEVKEALEGYILDPSCYPDNAAGLKTTPDGRFVLIPQPLDTQDDPLNWTPRKKAVIIGIIAYIAALADYTGGSAIIAVIPQAR